MTAVTGPRRSVTLGYDSAGRVGSSELTGGERVVFGYDGSFPMSETFTGPVAGSISRTFDSHGRVATSSLNGSPITLSYDADSLLTGIPEKFVTVVPDRHGTGTNALVLRPPDAIKPAFGEGSCQRHLRLARDAGLPHDTEEVAGLALDLDTPADIVALTTKIEMVRATGGNPAPRTAAVLGI